MFSSSAKLKSTYSFLTVKTFPSLILNVALLTINALNLCLRSACLLLVTVMALGCEDPSNVGLGLLDEQGGEPVRLDIDIFANEVAEFDEVTGATRTTSGFILGVSDVLAGRVEDPLYGCLNTTAYFDITIPASAEAFRDNPLESVSLNILPNSIYGDTTATLTLSVSELIDEFEGSGLKSDTLISSGAVIGTVDFVPTDSVVVFNFPQTWVDEHDADLRNEDYADLFHGLKVEISDGAIVGLNAANSQLIIRSADGSADAAITEIVTNIERCGDSSPSAGEIFIQDGRGNGFEVPIVLQPDSLPGIAIGRAALSLFSNTEAEANNLPANFRRPVMTELRLYGVEEDGDEVFLRSAIRDTLGTYLFTSFSVDPNSETFLRSLQDQILGDTRFDHYLIKPDQAVNTLSSVSIFSSEASDPEKRPKLILTVLEDL